MMNYQRKLFFISFFYLLLLNFSNANNQDLELDNSVPNGKINTVHPEILVITDQKFRSLFSDYSELSNKMVSFLEKINEIYSQLSSPQVKLHLTGIVNMDETDPSKNNMVWQENREHLFEKINADSYQFDVAVLMVGTYGRDHSNFLLKGTNGVTTGLACDFPDNLVVLGFKNQNITGYSLGAAHEIAHTFSADHQYSEEIHGCRSEEDEIMSPFSQKSKTFSNCSKQVMKAFFNSKKAECLLNVPV